MGRIPIVREDDPETGPEAQAFLKRAESGFAEVFNALRLLANHPRQANGERRAQSGPGSPGGHGERRLSRPAGLCYDGSNLTAGGTLVYDR